MYSFQAHPQPRVVADSLQESEIKKHSKYIPELRKKEIYCSAEIWKKYIDAHFQQTGKLMILTII